MAVKTNANKKSMKIKTDLFRFATLRTPQLISKDRRKLGFVEHPSPKESIFLKGIDSKEDLLVVKEKLFNTASSFSSFKTVEEVKVFAGNLWKFSMWLSKNQNNLEDATELADKIGRISVLSIGKQMVLWNNVFYDILSRENPQVRQACLQLLVAMHFLNNHSDYNSVKDLRRMAKSRVVIPNFFKRIFSTSNTTSAEPFQQRASQDSAIKKQETRNKKLLAEEEVKALRTIKEELLDLEAKHRLEYDVAYEKAAIEHSKITVKLIDDYQKSNKAKQDLKKIAEDQSIELNRIPDQHLERFNFSFPKVLSTAYTNKKISFPTENFIATQRLIESPVATAIEILDQKIFEQEKIAAELIELYPKSILIDGIKMSAARTYIPSYSFSSKLERKAQGYDLKILLSFNAAYANAFFETCNFTIHYGSETCTVNEQDIVVLPSSQPEIIFVLLKVISFTDKEFKIKGTARMRLSLEGEFQLDNDKSYKLASKITTPNKELSGVAEETTLIVEEEDGTTSFGITKIGVADYRKVEQELCCYIPGEVSQIENIMAREYKEKMTRNLIRSEDILESTIENEIEELNDTTSTTRNEMNSEVAHVLEKDRSMNLGFSTGASGTYFGTTFSASMNGDISTAQSSSKSDTTARTYAEDVTKRALERVVQKNTIKRTTKILKEFEENNKHGYDNRNGEKHVTGIFRWIDKVYKNQLVNYGKRLVYEFMLPEPAKYYKELIIIEAESDDSGGSGGGTNTLVEPTHPSAYGINTASNITRANYQTIAGHYGVSVPVPPDETVILQESYSKSILYANQGQTTTVPFQSPLTIPTDYACTSIHHHITFIIQCVWPDQPWYIKVNTPNTWLIHNQPKYGENYLTDRNYTRTLPAPGLTGLINTTVECKRIKSYTLVLKATCTLKPTVFSTWQNEVYDEIIKVYNQELDKYNQAMAAAANNNAVDQAAEEEASKLKTNPKYNKQFILNELKRLCIEMMLAPFDAPVGKDFYKKGECKTYSYKLTEDLDKYARQVKFFEQAFDWSILSHIFYPYYWAKKCSWKDLFQSLDSVDHVLQEFLQSGMGRVLVPVRDGFEDAVIYFMETGEIWYGTGLVLDSDDELYLSIIDETTIIEGRVEDEWETIVPTALTIIQGKSAFLDDEALPCCEEEEGLLSSSENILELLEDKE